MNRPSLRILAVLLACAVFLPASIAVAQDQDADTRARAAFADGERAFAAGDHATALLHFKRAFELAPHDAVRFNIATSLRRLGRFREAVVEYEVVAQSVVVDPETAARARAAIVEVRAQLATLIVEGPAGADVYVDAERVCTPPCRLELDPRSHSVLVRGAAGEETRRVELVGGKTTTLVFQLRARGKLKPRARSNTTAAKRPAEREPSSAPGVLTWVGGGLVLVGAVGTTYFGLSVRSLRNEHDEHPTTETQADGNRARDLTNVSLGVAVLGAAFIAVDLLLVNHGGSSARAPFQGRLSF